MICLSRFQNTSLPKCRGWDGLCANFFMFMPTEQHFTLGEKNLRYQEIWSIGINLQQLKEFSQVP